MKSLKPRIMYIERKAGNLTGEARIGRVTFSRTGRSIYYQGREFKKLNPAGAKSNYFESETGEDYWISGCKKDGGDCLYAGIITIDENVREEYWTEIRQLPNRLTEAIIHCDGKYAR